MKKLLVFLFVVLTGLSFAQTYGTYYQSAEGLKGAALKDALNNIIKGHTMFPYTSSSTDVWDILKQTDKDPSNSANVIFLYSGQSIIAGLAGDEFRDGTGWTREHVWPQSRGDFNTDTPGVGTDVHNLRPENDGVNSTRSNRSYDYCKDCIEVYYNGIFTGSYIDKNEYTFEPRDAVKGDVARIIFYMATRYEGKDGELDMEPTETIPDILDKQPIFGRLSTLLEWNRIDPVDDWERNRNEIIYTYFQTNRNPFIDFPELAEYLWGNATEATWSSTFSTFPKNEETDVEVNTTVKYVFTNPVRNLDNSEITNATVANLLSLKEINASGLDVACTATIDDSKKVITLTPTADLKYVQTYYASLAAVEDANENVNPFTEITFTTRVQDLTVPSFTSIPEDGATTMFITSSISFTFDEDIRNFDNSEITNENAASLLSLKETDQNGASVAFTASFDARKRLIKLTPNANLKNSQLYYVTINPVEDYSNNATSTANISFTTVDESLNSRVIISQYYEGASNDKYIEITNMGDVAIDLSTYFLGRFSNTDSPLDADIYTDGDALSGTIAPWQTLVYRNAGAINPAYAVAISYAITSATYFNGNDPIALMKDGNMWGNRVDCIYGPSPGGTLLWGAEKSLYRKASVSTGNKNMSVLDGSGEWTLATLAAVGSATSEVSEYLGTHLFTTVILNINELTSGDLSVFPNPNNGKFYIQLKDSFVSNYKIEVFNLVGMKVLETTSSTQKTEININLLRQGVYFVRVDDGKNIYTQKIVKQ